uniref:UvrD_C_2 domain-containing protein n=1 Tax=Globodera pallida TaxID=36090 RepID=A0A183BTU7_GLOPA
MYAIRSYYEFPLRPGSVMTINKSQGQTLTHVGVLLDKSQCFSHGQLYTALSRVRDSANIRVCTKRADRRIRNVVMTELLLFEKVFVI